MNLRRSLENLFRGQAVLLTTRSKDDPNMAVPVTSDDPLPVVLAGGSAGSTGSTDPDSAREATLQQVRDAIQALAPLLGNTDGLETLAATNRDLLTNLGSYTDGLENLLTLLNTNTDDIEALLSALGVNDQNVIGKLEALRVLTESTNTHMQAANGNTYILASQAQGSGIKTLLPEGAATQTTLEAVRALLAAALTVQGNVNVGNFPATQAVSAASLPLPAGAATQATLAQVLTAVGSTQPRSVTRSTTPGLLMPYTLSFSAGASLSSASSFMSNTTPVRIFFPSAWTTADLTVQVTSPAGGWADLYDEYGAPYTIKAVAGQAAYIAPGPLIGVSQIRLRSGTPSAPVNQASAVDVRVEAFSL
ncbi:hypothetical protein WDJ50_02495 [Deinococcus sp. VB142]|uniref:Uncharacterized protein n=1 Tax=Deinococcus sp. VB142 TaxID=3112952 RepID=A0AAU6Q4B6_9DEIO